MDLGCWAMWGWSGGGLGPVLPHVLLWMAISCICGLASVAWACNAEHSGLQSPEIDPEGEPGGSVWISAAGLCGVGLVAG